MSGVRLQVRLTDILLEEFGDEKAKVLNIGPAGEKLSLISAVMNDRTEQQEEVVLEL